MSQRGMRIKSLNEGMINNDTRYHFESDLLKLIKGALDNSGYNWEETDDQTLTKAILEIKKIVDKVLHDLE
jgi:hypothetical protein